MSVTTSSSAAPVGSSRKGVDAESQKEDWGRFAPKAVGLEDTMGAKRTAEVWSLVYQKIGLASAGEEEKKAVRCALYAWACANGLSRESAFKSEVTTAYGKTFPVVCVYHAAGRDEVRRFFRANMEESYYFLKGSEVMNTAPFARFIAEMAGIGISADVAFATADWMDNCPLFTPAEAQAHNKAFQYSIQRARFARGGRHLEDVEAERVHRSLQAQGNSGHGNEDDTF